MNTGLRRIGQYELSRRLISGKMGEVWLAYDPQTRGYVTIKMFYTELEAHSQAILEFCRRVERVASLQHPNIVRIRDVSVFASMDSDSQPGSMVCVAMDYVEGQSLDNYIHNTLKMGKMRPGADIVQLFSSISMAIDYAHQQGIIHGNLKPGNILLRRGGDTSDQVGEPVLTDFDYVRLLQNTGVTASPLYLSPEQIRGHAPTERSDTYSLGVILYELCTGVLPFRGNRPIAIMTQHLYTPPTLPALMNPTISSALTNVILRSLAKEPEKRFPSASSLTVAMAHALGTPVPETLSRLAYMPDSKHEVNYGDTLQPFVQADVMPFLEPMTSRKNGAATRNYSASNGAGTTFSPSIAARRRKKRVFSSWYLICIFALLFAGLATLGTLVLFSQGKGIAPNGLVGQAFFLSSGKIDADNPQGMNDELQVVLAHIPDPPTGKSYYAWLLTDDNVSEALPLLLGRLQVDHGNIRLLYPGNQQHTNLLGVASRFLITIDDAHHPTNNPLIDTSTWRYYAAIPVIPSPADKLHFSMLDHLRHLLVDSPELSIRGLHGGLAFWFVKNAATVSTLASSARDAWHRQDPVTIRNQVIRILDYLDGTLFAHTDLPAGTPLLADAHTSQVALLGPPPSDPWVPGYAFGGESIPGYVYLISEHMAGAVGSPQTTPEQRKLAVQINTRLDEVKRLFEQVGQDAKQLLNMTQAQLLQPSALTLLNDLATRAQEAYTGQLNPSPGQPGGGALWIYGALQRLVAFDIRPYADPAH